MHLHPSISLAIFTFNIIAFKNYILVFFFAYVDLLYYHKILFYDNICNLCN